MIAPDVSPVTTPDLVADPAPEVYCIQPEAVWDAARRAYLEGGSSIDICRRYGLARSTFHARAGREGWRRKDQPPRTLSPYIELQGDVDELSFFDLSEMAAMRLRQAILSGRSNDAAGWLTVVRQLREESRTYDPPAHWDDTAGEMIGPDLDKLDKLDTSRRVQPLSPQTRPDPETPVPPLSFVAPEPCFDAENVQIGQ